MSDLTLEDDKKKEKLVSLLFLVHCDIGLEGTDMAIAGDDESNATIILWRCGDINNLPVQSGA